MALVAKGQQLAFRLPGKEAAVTVFSGNSGAANFTF
jgi:hypothetical protein